MNRQQRTFSVSTAFYFTTAGVLASALPYYLMFTN